MPNQQSNLEQQFNQPSQPLDLPKRPQFNLKYILIVLVLATMVGGGILTYQYWWLPKQETKVPELTIKDEAANWQTYRNEEYGFEIKYPSEWYLKEYPNCRDLSEPDCLGVIIIQNMENVSGITGYLSGSSVFVMTISTDYSSSIEEWVVETSRGYKENIREKQKNKMLKEIKTIKIGGEENKVWWSKGITQETMYFLRNGRGYLINYFSSDVDLFNQNKETFNKILSAFKFIK